MRVWLLQALNSVYVKVLLRLSKWTVIGLLTVFLLAGVGFRFLLPRAIDIAKQRSNTQVVKTPGGESRILYKDKALPQNFQEELKAEPSMLIYENQLRSARDSTKPDEQGQPEDAPLLNKNNINPAERRRLQSLAISFLSRWESFGPSTGKQEYQAELAPYAIFDALPSLVDREDNLQNSNIAPGSRVGSKFLMDGYSPKSHFDIRRYDGQTAYITTLGEIETTGPSLVFNGTRFLRSYALIVERTDSGWKIQRAAAQTRTQIVN